MPTVGVLFTYHNEGPVFEQTLASLKAQTWPPDEVWIFDDASATPVQQALKLDPSFQVVRSETNIGPASARNQLAKLCGCDYLHFHDADDLFERTWTRRILEKAQDQGPDLILTECNSVRSGQPYGHRFIGLTDLRPGADLVPFALAHALLPACATYRREFFLSSGGYREDLWQSEDYELHVRLASHLARWAVCLEPLVTVCVRHESRSQNQLEVWQCRKTALDQLRPSLDRYGNPLADAYIEVGARLWSLGEQPLARECFRAARAVGRPSYRGRGAGFQLLARAFGPTFAERLAAVYRKALPSGLRAHFHSGSA